MPVRIKPGPPDRGRLVGEVKGKKDEEYTITVPDGTTVNIVYED